MPTISHESILKEFSRKLKLAVKILILYTGRNTSLVILKGIPVKKYFKEVCNTSFLFRVAPKELGTNEVNIPYLVSITPRNICSGFTSFGIICFT